MRRAGLLGEAGKAELSNGPSEARRARARCVEAHRARGRTPGAGCEGLGCLARPGRPSLATARAKRGERGRDALKRIAREAERPEQEPKGWVAWRGREGRA